MCERTLPSLPVLFAIEKINDSLIKTKRQKHLFLLLLKYLNAWLDDTS